MTYKILCCYGCFSKDIVKGGCLSWYAVKCLSGYFDDYTVMETSDKWEAVALFAKEYHDSKVDLNAYDFQDGTDCIGVTYYALREYDRAGNLTGIIFESDFQTVNLNEVDGGE